MRPVFPQQQTSLSVARQLSARSGLQFELFDFRRRWFFLVFLLKSHGNGYCYQDLSKQTR